MDGARFNRQYDDTAELGEVYGTIVSLPDDEILVGILEEYAEESRTLACGRALVHELHGLPGFVIGAWNRRGFKSPAKAPGKEEDLLQQYLAAQEDAKIPAYEIDFRMGLSQVPGSQTHLLIQMQEASTDIPISIWKNSRGSANDYEIRNGAGVPIGDMQTDRVALLLQSLIDDEWSGYRDIDEHAFETLIDQLGNMYGVTHREWRLTGELDATAEPADTKAFGAVVYVEKETSKDSTKTFIVERLQKYSELDADVVWRMEVAYSTEALRFGDRDTFPARVALEKVVASPAKYRINQISCEEVISGNARPLEVTEEQLQLFVETLQEVVASVSDGFTPVQP